MRKRISQRCQRKTGPDLRNDLRSSDHVFPHSLIVKMHTEWLFHHSQLVIAAIPISRPLRCERLSTLEHLYDKNHPPEPKRTS